MSELTVSAQIADDAISSAEGARERGSKDIRAWFWLAYAALRILANMADSVASLSEAIDHRSGCIVTRPAEY